MNFQECKNTELIGENTNFIELFSVQEKMVEPAYTGEDISSDGGLLLLKEVENQIGIISKLTDCITDERDQRYVQHTLKKILSQRIYQIASGYEDANDCNKLRCDAIIKMCAESLPVSDPDLASQPTMSCFENSVSRSEL
ncbi:MAG: transposase [Bacteroidia bacterium]|nr:transposase [Bacteroidia bacterium]